MVEINFDYLPQRGRGGGIWKIKERDGNELQGQVFLKGWEGGGEPGWHFSYLILSRFIIFTFRNYFTLCKIKSRIWRPWCSSYHYCTTSFNKAWTPARDLSEIRDGKDLWQRSPLEIRLNAFRRSTIPPQKQFINSSSIFSTTIILWKRVILICLKMNLWR